MRSAECGISRRVRSQPEVSNSTDSFRTPHSAFRTLGIPFSAMSYQTLLFEIKDVVALITINRPDKLNALNDKVMAELVDSAERIATEDEIKCAIITGADTKTFVAW